MATLKTAAIIAPMMAIQIFMAWAAYPIKGPVCVIFF